MLSEIPKDGLATATDNGLAERALLFLGLRKRIIPVEISSGRDGLVWRCPDQDKYIEATTCGNMIHDHARNITDLEGRGVRPVSFADIYGQTKDLPKDWLLLFDSSPFDISPGNHWRVSKVDEEGRVVRLSFCSVTGGYKFDFVDEFDLPMDEPFFSGASVWHGGHCVQTYWAEGLGPHLDCPLTDYQYISSGKK